MLHTPIQRRFGGMDQRWRWAGKTFRSQACLYFVTYFQGCFELFLKPMCTHTRLVSAPCCNMWTVTHAPMWGEKSGIIHHRLRFLWYCICLQQSVLHYFAGAAVHSKRRESAQTRRGWGRHAYLRNGLVRVSFERFICTVNFVLDMPYLLGVILFPRAHGRLLSMRLILLINCYHISWVMGGTEEGNNFFSLYSCGWLPRGRLYGATPHWGSPAKG